MKEVKMLKQKQKMQEKEESLEVLAKAYNDVYLNNPFVNSEMINQLPEMQNKYLVCWNIGILF